MLTPNRKPDGNLVHRNRPASKPAVSIDANGKDMLQEPKTSRWKLRSLVLVMLILAWVVNFCLLFLTTATSVVWQNSENANLRTLGAGTPPLTIQPLSRVVLEDTLEASLLERARLRVQKLLQEDEKVTPFRSVSEVTQQRSTQSSVTADALTKPEEMKPIQNTMAFCLLIKDDNDILNEWLAYHYHNLNLRRLIVAVDPASRTSPLPLLETWNQAFGLQYEIWKDSNFMPDYFLQGDYSLVPRMIKWEDSKANLTKWNDSTGTKDNVEDLFTQINNHRFRQARFLQKCAATLQDEAAEAARANPMATIRQWVTHIDTDEYIGLNPTIPDSPQRPPKLASGSLLDYLEKSVAQGASLVNWPCISMPRILYGSVQDAAPTNLRIPATSFDKADAYQTRTGSGNMEYMVFNRTRLESLRWKYHANYDRDSVNKQPKVVMDVHGFPPFNVSRKAFSIHRPSMHLCRTQAQMQVSDGDRFPLIVRHYLGSWERFAARKDPRRTSSLYWQKAAIQDKRDADDTWIESWLPSFVQTHGPAKVSQVLRDYLIQSSTTGIDPVDAPEKPLQLGRSLPMKDDSSSACLLIKDDNDILGEWIAYHYHVLKLRTLIVASDPSSSTSPSNILDRWKDLVDIVEWQDSNYMPSFFLEGHYELVPNLLGNATNQSVHNNNLNSFGGSSTTTPAAELVEINNHRFRQFSFLTSCLQTLKERNKTWTFHIDTDEYIVIHPTIRKQDHWRKVPLDPDISQPNGLLKLLKDASQNYTKGLSYPCVSMPRLLFGSKEDTENVTRFNHIPSSFDASRFESLRWKYHSNYDEDIAFNGKPKVMLDLSGLPTASHVFTGQVFSIHRPALHKCRSDKEVLFEAPHKFPFTTNHYLGDWKRYSNRADARRSQEKYDSKAAIAERGGKDDDWIDGWLGSFVRIHGLETTKYLLSEYLSEGTMPGTKPQRKMEVTEREKYEDADKEDAVAIEDMNPAELDDTTSSATSFNVSQLVQNFDKSQHMEFSACLLVKDDNDILNEWIAYHYHVLGLRYIIVATDAKSQTSPSRLLQEWRDFGMTIEEWKDEDFMPDIYFQKAYHLQPRLVKIKKNKHKWLDGDEDPQVVREYYNTIQDHRFRQITFLSSCMKRLKEQGQTWMIHIDTDEYVVINPKLREQGKMISSGFAIPATAEADVVPRLLNSMIQTGWKALNYPCVSLPRLLYGSLEDAETSALPESFDRSRFETLRWKYHTDFEDAALNKQPKVIVDVSIIPDNDRMFTDGRVFSIHRPSRFLCRTQGQMFFEDVEDYPLSVNHYLGTFERFSSREDPRRNRKLYDQKASVKAGKDNDWIDTWLQSFLDVHGEEQVAKLLTHYRTQS